MIPQSQEYQRGICVIVPILDECENLLELHAELIAALREHGEDFEVTYVDDGSTDGSRKVLAELVEGDERVRAIILRRNYGQTAAFAAGFERARFDRIVTMDGDLQNDPRDIPRLWDKLSEGFDVVSGWRIRRKDNLLRRIPSAVANRVISAVTGVKLHDYGCSLKIYRTEILKEVRLYGEMHRFLPALCHWHGASIAEIAANHRPRLRGASKYGLGRTLRVVMDLVTVKFLMSFSTRPLHVFGLVGIVSLLVGMVINLYLSYHKLMYGMDLAQRPLLLLGVLLVFTGFQFISMGLLGEMLARIYHESQQKPVYSIRKILARGSGKPTAENRLTDRRRAAGE